MQKTFVLWPKWKLESTCISLPDWSLVLQSVMDYHYNNKKSLSEATDSLRINMTVTLDSDSTIFKSYKQDEYTQLFIYNISLKPNIHCPI